MYKINKLPSDAREITLCHERWLNLNSAGFFYLAHPPQKIRFLVGEKKPHHEVFYLFKRKSY